MICIHVYVETPDRCQEYSLFFEARKDLSLNSELTDMASFLSQLALRISADTTAQALVPKEVK